MNADNEGLNEFIGAVLGIERLESREYDGYLKCFHGGNYRGRVARFASEKFLAGEDPGRLHRVILQWCTVLDDEAGTIWVEAYEKSENNPFRVWKATTSGPSSSSSAIAAKQGGLGPLDTGVGLAGLALTTLATALDNSMRSQERLADKVVKGADERESMAYALGGFAMAKEIGNGERELELQIELYDRMAPHAVQALGILAANFGNKREGGSKGPSGKCPPSGEAKVVWLLDAISSLAEEAGKELASNADARTDKSAEGVRKLADNLVATSNQLDKMVEQDRAKAAKAAAETAETAGGET